MRGLHGLRARVPLALVPLALVSLALVAPRAHAQGAPRVEGSSANLWVDVASDLWLTPEYDVQIGARVQRAELGAAPQQTELRMGVQRTLGKRFRVAGGGVLAHNSPYAPFATSAPYDEMRLWQHVLMDQHFGRFTLQHRYRIEERWIERPQPPVSGIEVDPDVSFGIRARYQLKATTPLGSGTGAHAPYATAYDELLKSVGPHASTNVIDQNRAYAGVGVRWSRAVRAELGYLNQRILRANGRQLEHAHNVQLSLGLTRQAPQH